MRLIYILKDKGTGLYKIGVTTNLNKRFESIRTGNPSIKLIHVMEGDGSTEMAYHWNFKRKLIIGEWFKLDANDLKLIIKSDPDEVRELYIKGKYFVSQI